VKTVANRSKFQSTHTVNKMENNKYKMETRNRDRENISTDCQERTAYSAPSDIIDLRWFSRGAQGNRAIRRLI
jgi:hypothetical protein